MARGAMAEAVREHMPQLYRLYELLYGKPSELVTRDGKVVRALPRSGGVRGAQAESGAAEPARDRRRSVRYVPITALGFDKGRNSRMKIKVLTHPELKVIVLDAYDVMAYVVTKAPSLDRGHILTLDDRSRYPAAWERVLHD